jgi:hypothetical protein
MNNMDSSLIHILPNPATNNITIQNQTRSALKLRLFSITGLLVLSVDCHEEFNTIPINDIATGIYFCQIIYEDGSVQTRRLSIQR